MNERWVKASRVENGAEFWLNIALATDVTRHENGPMHDVPYTSIMFGRDFITVRESPEHFLPHSAIALERAMYFIGHVCSIPEGAASGDGLVREAKRIRDYIRALA